MVRQAVRQVARAGGRGSAPPRRAVSPGAARPPLLRALLLLITFLSGPDLAAMYTHDATGLHAGVRLFQIRADAPGDLAQPAAVYRLPAAAFDPVDAADLHLEPRPRGVWLKLELPPALQDGSRVWLQIQAPPRARIVVYDPHEPDWRPAAANGAPRAAPGNLAAVTQVVTLRPYGPRPVLLHVTVARPATLALQLWHPEPWTERQMRQDFAWGLYFGLMLATLAFATLTAALLQAPEIRAIAAVLAAAIVLALSNGFTSWLWLADYPDLAWSLRELAVVGFFVTAAWSTRAGLRDPAVPPGRRRLITALLGVTAIGGAWLVLLDAPTAAVRGAFGLWLVISLAALRQSGARWRAAGAPYQYLTLLLGWQILGGVALFVVIDGHAHAPAAFAALWQASLIVLAVALGVVTLWRIRADHHRRLQENTAALLSSEQARTLLDAQVKARTGALNTALHQLMAALAREREARARRHEFLCSAAHDLRTPLAVLLATLDNLLADAPATTPPAVRADYDLLARTCQRLVATVDQHLAPTSGALAADAQARRAPCALTALLRDTVDAARVLAPDHRFVIQTAGLPAQFACDPEMTRVALRNLVDNAAKYTPPGTTIEVRGGRVGQRASDAVWLAVTDNGPGVTAAERAALFTPQFRGANAAGRPGQGLGLALARRMIEHQGGLLTVAAAPGTGLTCHIWLPGTVVAREPPPDAAALPLPPVPAAVPSPG